MTQSLVPAEAEAIRSHCLAIERCNQRGGRCLSVVDLMEAGTLPPDLAAYALAAVGHGASFLVGAVPGGAGKTTIMSALANLAPLDVKVAVADGLPAIERGLSQPTPRCCYICHEIGQAPIYAYLWGEELRAYFRLPTAGHMMATNLHADTYEQAFDQICAINGVPEESLRWMNLMFFLSVRHDGGCVTRRVATVWESDGASQHRQVYEAGPGLALRGSALVSPGQFAEAQRQLDHIAASGARSLGEVRTVLVATADGKRS